MPDYGLSDIEKKIQLLIKRLQSYHKENQNLEKKLLENENKIKKQQEQIKEYEEKIRIFKMTSPSEDGEGVDNEARREIRTTINSYIKEIDNCIAALNK